jgi:flagellar basal-body rod protein FlgC
MSGMFGALDAATSGLTLGRTMMDVVSNNIANVNTVRAAGQAPFRASIVVAQSMPGTDGVAVQGTVQQGGPPDVVFDPDNPLADTRGYVTRPKVDLTEEMTNMMMATRLYQANLTVMQQARDSYSAALKIGTGG